MADFFPSLFIVSWFSYSLTKPPTYKILGIAFRIVKGPPTTLFTQLLISKKYIFRIKKIAIDIKKKTKKIINQITKTKN